MSELRTERVHVMITPSMKERIDQMARRRDGRPSASSLVYDILVDYFAACDNDDDGFDRQRHGNARERDIQAAR